MLMKYGEFSDNLNYSYVQHVHVDYYKRPSVLIEEEDMREVSKLWFAQRLSVGGVIVRGQRPDCDPEAALFTFLGPIGQNTLPPCHHDHHAWRPCSSCKPLTSLNINDLNFLFQPSEVRWESWFLHYNKLNYLATRLLLNNSY